MSDAQFTPEQTSSGVAKLPLAAALVALVGLADAIYLTIEHFQGATVPCGITGGCEVVLTSAYASVFGIPLSMLGALAYFTAFSLAILAAYGNRLMWKLFGVQAGLMAAFSVYLLYLQAFVISNANVPWRDRFCQFCLLSAATSFTLFVIALASRFRRA